MRGRPPKPTRLKVLTGTYRADRHEAKARNEPMPRRGRPKCPAWLSVEAKIKWRQLVPELDRLGLLTIIDGGCLAAYCEAWAELRWATEQLAAEGHYLTTPTGTIRPHPAIAMQRSAWRAIKELASLYGLDPSSRSKLSAQPPAEDADPLEKLMRDLDTE